MRRFLTTTAGLFFLIGATAAVGKPADMKDKKGQQTLETGLQAVALSAAAEKGPPPKTEDKDQGDDHASDRAIFRVCNKDTPAARRAAICDPQESPD